jgi:RIO-like serine/threonine protein kinase
MLKKNEPRVLAHIHISNNGQRKELSWLPIADIINYEQSQTLIHYDLNQGNVLVHKNTDVFFIEYSLLLGIADTQQKTNFF